VKRMGKTIIIPVTVITTLILILSITAHIGKIQNIMNDNKKSNTEKAENLVKEFVNPEEIEDKVYDEIQRKIFTWVWVSIIIPFLALFGIKIKTR